jgi:hypothetical protein
MRYLALHFQKESQAPPKGWRGHRFMHSRGYLHDATPVLRARAREQLRHRRELWKLERAGVPDDLVDELAALAMEVARSTSWQMVRVHELAADRSRPRPVMPRSRTRNT